MKLFVDDIRACPEGWVVARTVTEAIRLLATQDIEEVSLDHDIACRLPMEHGNNGCCGIDETFEPVAYFIKRCPSIPLAKVRIHTANIVAGRRLADILGIPYDNEIYAPVAY